MASIKVNDDSTEYIYKYVNRSPNQLIFEPYYESIVRCSINNGNYIPVMNYNYLFSDTSLTGNCIITGIDDANHNYSSDNLPIVESTNGLATTIETDGSAFSFEVSGYIFNEDDQIQIAILALNETMFFDIQNRALSVPSITCELGITQNNTPLILTINDFGIASVTGPFSFYLKGVGKDYLSNTSYLSTYDSTGYLTNYLNAVISGNAPLVTETGKIYFDFLNTPGFINYLSLLQMKTLRTIIETNNQVAFLKNINGPEIKKFLTKHVNVNQSLITQLYNTNLNTFITEVQRLTDICFPGDTPILTDQGSIPIRFITTTNTINKNPILAVTKSISTTNYLIEFAKHAFGFNIPSQRTSMTPEHKVYYKRKWVEAKYIPFGKKIKYNSEYVYNILLNKHSSLSVNNMICESLNPHCKVAQLFLEYGHIEEVEPKMFRSIRTLTFT